MVAMSLVYSLSAYPFGVLADRVSHTFLLAAGLAVLIAADLVLAASPHWLVVLAGVSLWGVHVGLPQGLRAALIAHAALPDLRGTASGVFNLVSGPALFLASVSVAAQWVGFGGQGSFLRWPGTHRAAQVIRL